MTDEELIAALRNPDGGKASYEAEYIEMAERVMTAAADRLSELSPSRLSANDEGVTLPEGTISMHGNDVTIMFGAREDAEEAFEALEDALSTKPEAPEDELDDIEEQVRGILADPSNAFPPTPASGEQMKVVAYIQREALEELLKHRDASTTVFSGLVAKPFGDVASLVTLEAANKAIADRDAEIERLRRKNRELHRRAQAHESEQATLLRETGYHEQKRLADMWSKSWKSEFDRLMRTGQEVKTIYEVCAKVLGLPHGRYHSVGDLKFGERTEECALWANVFTPDGIETFSVREVVERLAALADQGAQK